MDINIQIAEAETSLQRKLDWVERFDIRVAFAAGINIAMLGVLANASASVASWGCGHYMVFGIAGILLLISLVYIYFSQFPKTKSHNSSLIYFGTIAKIRFREFQTKTKNRTREEYLDDLLSQIHINATILSKKFTNLKRALILLAVALIPWLVSIFLSKIYFK